jgi:anti-sigma factor RsiW
MSEPEPPIAEEELHAYVDDRLDPVRRSAVARHLQQDPEAAERVAAYGAQRDWLRAAFCARAAEPIPPELNLSKLVEERLQRQQHASWRVAAAVALAVSAGGAGGWFVHAKLLTGERVGIAALQHEAAASHLVYAADRQRPTELGAARRDDLVEWLSARLKRPVSPPDLAAVGYRLIGGRLVATEHGAAALFMYENDRAMRLTIFVRPMQVGQSSPIVVLDIGDVDGCAWIDKGIGYTLIADEPYKELLRFSKFVRRQLDART